MNSSPTQKKKKKKKKKNTGFYGFFFFFFFGNRHLPCNPKKKKKKKSSLLPAQGGVGLVQVPTQIQALQAKVVSRLLEPERLAWKVLQLHHLSHAPQPRQLAYGASILFSTASTASLQLPPRFLGYVTAFRALQPQNNATSLFFFGHLILLCLCFFFFFFFFGSPTQKKKKKNILNLNLYMRMFRTLAALHT
ncbi:hypothetical protein ABBQ32_003713 [Trebouxia sp. C0010 RCD-2024]